jgi:hypothetical protein
MKPGKLLIMAFWLLSGFLGFLLKLLASGCWISGLVRASWLPAKLSPAVLAFRLLN